MWIKSTPSKKFWAKLTYVWNHPLWSYSHFWNFSSTVQKFELSHFLLPWAHFLPDFHEILRLWKSNIIFHPKKYLWGYLKNCNSFITRVWKTWIDNVRSLGQSNFPIFCHICILHEERKSLRGKSMGTKAIPETFNLLWRLWEPYFSFLGKLTQNDIFSKF